MQSASPRPPAVLVDGVNKSFHMPTEQVHTLKERALHPFRRRSGEDFEALKDVSFSVEQGEFFGIVGRNGSGKSTLLKCMAGIYGTDSGAIYVNGRISTFIELGVGFNPDLAARDNVLLNAIMLGVEPSEARRRFDEVIAFAELEDFVDLKFKNYSSGMMVRLAFAAAIQADADILLIDEVLAVGDAAFQQKCFDVFNRLKEQGKTILFVTHDMASVVRFCDRAILLEHGKVVTIDEPTSVAKEYLALNFGQAAPAKESEGIHWADGPTRILETWTEDQTGVVKSIFASGEVSIFKARVRFEEPMKDPNFNIVWVSEKGENIFAVATANRDTPTGEFAAGEEILFAVSFLAAMAPGRYSITANIARAGAGAQIVERWDHAASILITNPSAGGGLVDFPHDLEIHRAPTPAQPAPEHAT
jgi:ABC-type polysaccharide/polyol phosphate transport system ATPase subunit